MKPSAHRARTVERKERDGAPLAVEAAAAVLLAALLYYRSVPLSRSPCAPTAAAGDDDDDGAAEVLCALALCALCSSVIAFGLVLNAPLLARQGVVQGHCLVPTLLVVLLRCRHDSLGQALDVSGTGPRRVCNAARQ